MRRGYMHPDGELSQFKIETLRRQGFPTQVRSDFREETYTDEDGNEQTMWSFAVETVARRWRNPARSGRLYPQDEVVWWRGKVWQSTTNDNAEEPGIGEQWERVIGYTGIREEELAEEPPAWQQPVPGTEHPWYEIGKPVTHDDHIWMSNHPHNVWEPGAPHPALRIWIDMGPVGGPIPGDLCDTTAAWDVNNAATYQAEVMAGNTVHVKHGSKIWKSKNATHLWIAPALDGNGAISWEFVKDCPI